nr:MAG TPA: hypothetical protein [Inoviridae sp.]
MHKNAQEVNKIYPPPIYAGICAMNIFARLWAFFELISEIIQMCKNFCSLILDVDITKLT